MGVSRFEDHAQRVAEEFGPGHHGVQNLKQAILDLLQMALDHDLEWCALAVEEHAKTLAASIRERKGK